MDNYTDTDVRAQASGREMSLGEGLIWLARRWRWLVLPGLVLLVVAVLPLMLRPTLYTATVSFISEGGSSADNVGGGAAALAGIFGGPRPSDVLVEVVESRAVREALSRTTFEEGGRTAPLYELLGYDDEPQAEAVSRTVNELEDRIRVEAARTGVVEISVTTYAPDLSRALARQLLEEVDTWERQRRVDQASLEREFMEERLEAAAAELRQAENQLQDWLQQNRDFSSAQKMFEHERLQRRVSLNQEFYLALASRHENVRLASLRDLTSIDLLDQPEEWLPPDEKPYLFRAMVGFILGALLGLVAVLVRESLPESWRSPGGLRRSLANGRDGAS